jgi:mRNA interferase RelE/StbE
VILRIENSFDRDVDRIRDRKLLKKLRAFISTIKNVDTIREIPHLKKIEGYESFYRIQSGPPKILAQKGHLQIFSKEEIEINQDAIPTESSLPIPHSRSNFHS